MHTPQLFVTYFYLMTKTQEVNRCIEMGFIGDGSGVTIAEGGRRMVPIFGMGKTV